MKDNIREIIISTCGITIVAVVVALIVYGMLPSSEVSAGDILAYIGTVISAVCTITLAHVTITLSKQANDIAAKQSGVEQTNFNLQLRPFVIISNIKCQNMNMSDIKSEIDKPTFLICDNDNIPDTINDYRMYWIYLLNSTDYYITAKYKGYRVNDKTVKANKIPGDNVLEKVYIPSGQTKVFGLYAESGFWEKYSGESFVLQIELENRFGEKFMECAEILYRNGRVAGISEEMNQKYIFKANDMLFRTGKYSVDRIES